MKNTAFLPCKCIPGSMGTALKQDLVISVRTLNGKALVIYLFLLLFCDFHYHFPECHLVKMTKFGTSYREHNAESRQGFFCLSLFIISFLCKNGSESVRKCNLLKLQKAKSGTKMTASTESEHYIFNERTPSGRTVPLD